MGNLGSKIHMGMRGLREFSDSGLGIRFQDLGFRPLIRICGFGSGLSAQSLGFSGLGFSSLGVRV